MDNQALRVVTFSIKPDDKDGHDNVQALKDYAATKGISFSYLVLSAINEKNKELDI